MHSSKIIQDHATFRVLLQAVSRPGKVYKLSHDDTQQYPVVELLGCLLDNEVSLAVLDDSALEKAIARHTKSLLAPPEEADFVVASSGSTCGRLTGFKRGTLDYPDAGATVVYLVEKLEPEGGEVSLTGPGVNGTISLSISGFDMRELDRLREVNIEYPLGLDVIFIDRDSRIACFPRSTKIGVN
jgi:alpha-D-ribose 1-methylphosphonate 5-triphosphate synthase subunit PhnH